MKYELAVFDMDGTILNTLEDLTDSLNVVLTQKEFPQRTLEEVRSFVGNGIHKLVERGVPSGTSEKEVEEVFALFNSYYKLHCADKTKAYDGILELLKKLREAGMKTAVVSNKADFAVQDLCEQYFKGLFDAAAGEKPGARPKPAPDSVNAVLAQLDVPKEKAVYIGDSEVDVETAKNSGLDCIAVEWGFRDAAFLRSQGAKRIVADTNQLFKELC